MTSAHFLVSAARNTPKSLPKAAPGSEPSSRMRATMSGASSALATSSRSFASTGSGVFAGATTPYQEEASKPTSPCSATVGTSGSADGRFAPALASARTLRAAIRHVHDIDVGHALEQFAGQVISRTVAGRSEIEFARLFLRQRDQLLHAVRRHAGIDDQHDGRRRKQRDGSEVLGRIEGKLAIEGLVDGERSRRGE